MPIISIVILIIFVGDVDIRRCCFTVGPWVRHAQPPVPPPIAGNPHGATDAASTDSATNEPRQPTAQLRPIVVISLVADGIRLIACAERNKSAGGRRIP